MRGFLSFPSAIEQPSPPTLCPSLGEKRTRVGSLFFLELACLGSSPLLLLRRVFPRENRTSLHQREKLIPMSCPGQWDEQPLNFEARQGYLGAKRA